MKRIPRILAVLALAAVVAPAFAEEPKKPAAAPPQPQMTKEQQAEMEAMTKAATPGKEHQHLAAMAGAWDVLVRSWMAPGQPPAESKGTAVREMILGGRVLAEKVHGSFADMPFEGYGLSGFDNVSGKYWGSWQDTMGTGTMLSSGTCDAAWSCSFESTFNDPVTKKAKKSRMTSRQEGSDKEVDEFFDTGKDGRPMKTMEIVYTRHK